MEYTPTPGLTVSTVILWWLMLEGVGLLVLPIAFRLFRHLPDRGYALSKPLGLVLVNYVLWMGSTLGFLRNTWGNILLSAVLVFILSLWFYRQGRKQQGVLEKAGLAAWLSEHWRTVLATELVFTLAFVLWTLYKAYDPNIAVTEKPMEYAFLNAITRSSRFPAYDPWMSGYSISYYYFGYVMVATLAKFANIPTSYAFNLGIASLFALTASGAFSVVYNMVHVAARGQQFARGRARSIVGRAILYGVIAAVMIPLMGNLEGALEFAHAGGVGVTVNEPGNVTGPFWKWIDVKNLEGGRLSDTWYPTDGWWWWRASRVIHDKGLTGNDMEVIDEFPAFSFLLGDMHPHVLAYPFVFMVIALAFNLLLAGAQDSAPTTNGEWWLVYLCLGAIGFLNTWDMPFYFFLLAAAFALNRYLQAGARTTKEGIPAASAPPSLIERALGRWGGLHPLWLRQVVYRAVELAIASVVLYMPYWVYSRPQAGAGILPNLFNVSRFAQLFLMFGLFFVVLTALLVVLMIDLWRAGRVNGRSLLRQGLPIWLGTMVAFPLLLALVLVPIVALPSARTYIDDLLANPQVQQFLGPQTLTSLLRVSLRIRAGLLPPQLQEIRLPAGPWTFLLVSMLLAAVIFWFVRTVFARPSQPASSGVATEADAPLPGLGSSPDARQGLPDSRPASSTPDRAKLDLPSLHFAMLLAFVGLMLVFSVEFVYLRDAFGTRMNTVFKFYFQAWALLGLVAAFGVYYVVEGRSGNRIGQLAFGILFALLFAAGMLYPLGASLSRAGGFAGPATLDGMAFVARERPEEYAMVRWLNENVTGMPVIAEAVRGSFAYEHARVSSRTGLPTVMGWTGHEGQWHGLYDEIGERERDVNLLYAGSMQDAKRIMEKYDVTYVVVGYLEREEFPNAELKFARFMDEVFREGDTVIFKRRGK